MNVGDWVVRTEVWRHGNGAYRVVRVAGKWLEINVDGRRTDGWMDKYFRSATWEEIKARPIVEGEYVARTDGGSKNVYPWKTWYYPERHRHATPEEYRKAKSKPTCKEDSCKCFCHVSGEAQEGCCGRGFWTGPPKESQVDEWHPDFVALVRPVGEPPATRPKVIWTGKEGSLVHVAGFDAAFPFTEVIKQLEDEMQNGERVTNVIETETIDRANGRTVRTITVETELTQSGYDADLDPVPVDSDEGVLARLTALEATPPIETPTLPPLMRDRITGEAPLLVVSEPDENGLVKIYRGKPQEGDVNGHHIAYLAALEPVPVGPAKTHTRLEWNDAYTRGRASVVKRGLNIVTWLVIGLLTIANLGLTAWRDGTLDERDAALTTWEKALSRRERRERRTRLPQGLTIPMPRRMVQVDYAPAGPPQGATPTINLGENR